MTVSIPPDASGRPDVPRAVRIFDRYFFARPVLMPPVWTIVLLAAAHGKQSFFNSLQAESLRTWTGLVLCFCLYGGVYIFNQVFDVESDRLNDKLYFLPRNILSIRSALVQYGAITGIALAGGWWMGEIWFYTTVAITVLGIAYSAPLIRLKDRPFGGLLANAIGHGTLVYYLGSALSRPDSVPVWGASSSYALAVAGLYVLTTIPDRAGDQTTGKKTISTRFGPRAAAVIAAVLILAAGVVGIFHNQWPLVISAGISLPFFALTTACETFCGSAVRVALLSLSFFACLAFWPYVFVLVAIYLSTRWYYRRRFGVSYPRMSGGG